MTKHSAPPPAPQPASSASLFSWPTRAMCALIFCVTLLSYYPALQNGFIWDDNPGHVTTPELRSLSGLERIWFEVGATQQYYPLLHTAFWLEHRVWGDAPFGYHLVNILLHATAACLFGVALRRLAVRGAWLAAFLFAVHPVCVESVAWVSEQKNTLSTVLFLWAALAYWRFEENRRPSPYLLATALFVAALLTKSVTATLPAALLVVAWWRRGQLSWRNDLQPLLLWFIFSAGAALLTSSVERSQIGARGDDFVLSVVQRGLLAGRALWFYLGKLVWPANLVFIYPRWTIEAGAVWQYVFPLAALALLGALWWRRRQQRGPLAIALLFAGMLFPALGFVNVFPFIFSYVADHFQYAASLAVFAGIAAGLVSGFERLPRGGGIAVSLVLITGLATLTWKQSGIYRDVFTLYQTTIARNPACWMAHNNLAEALANSGRVPEAIPHLEKALQLRPGYPEAENNLGYDLALLGRPAEGIPHLQRALQRVPSFAEAHNNLGIAFMRIGRGADGIKEFEAALRLRPKYAVARFNLGLALANLGRPAEAITHFEQALRLNPAYPDAELNWAIALTVTERFPQAITHFERALQLRPGFADAHTMYGRGLAGAGRFDEAISHYRQALELNPAAADAHFNLALALRQTGRPEEAAQHYAEAQRLTGKR